MADRTFKLPNIEELTKQQEKIRALPLKGQHMIVGGPGTGKSVVALLRARKLKQESEKYHCLAFNKTLLQSNEQLFGEGLQHQQWQSWFNKLYEQKFNQKPPCLPKGRPNDNFPRTDWKAVLAQIEESRTQSNATTDSNSTDTALENDLLPFTENSDSDVPLTFAQVLADLTHYYLVIDEGQDMPANFYKALIKLGFNNFFVVADQNQKIDGDVNSSVQDIRNQLALKVSDVYPLGENFRNNYQIARLAESFYTDPASPKPELPEKPHHDITLPILYSYDESKFSSIVRRMIITAKNSPKQLIGVLCPNHIVREKYLNELIRISCNEEFLTTPITISTYDSHNKHQQSLTFDKGGIMVINSQSCKGLEFDHVFLVDINEHKAFGNDNDLLKKRFYVMTSRAKERLTLFRQINEDASHIFAILPSDDQKILEQRCYD